MKDLEWQLPEYKSIVSELTRDNHALKSIIEKKRQRQWVKEKQLITWLAKKTPHERYIRNRGCRVHSITRSLRLA